MPSKVTLLATRHHTFEATLRTRIWNETGNRGTTPTTGSGPCDPNFTLTPTSIQGSGSDIQCEIVPPSYPSVTSGFLARFWLGPNSCAYPTPATNDGPVRVTAVLQLGGFTVAPVAGVTITSAGGTFNFTWLDIDEEYLFTLEVTTEAWLWSDGVTVTDEIVDVSFIVNGKVFVFTPTGTGGFGVEGGMKVRRLVTVSPSSGVIPQGTEFNAWCRDSVQWQPKRLYYITDSGGSIVGSGEADSVVAIVRIPDDLAYISEVTWDVDGTTVPFVFSGANVNSHISGGNVSTTPDTLTCNSSGPATINYLPPYELVYADSEADDYTVWKATQASQMGVLSAAGAAGTGHACHVDQFCTNTNISASSNTSLFWRWAPAYGFTGTEQYSDFHINPNLPQPPSGALSIGNIINLDPQGMVLGYKFNAQIRDIKTLYEDPPFNLTEYLIEAPPVGASDYEPVLCEDDRKQIWCFYERDDPATSPRTSIRYRTSNDNGETWSTDTTLITGAKHPEIVKDPASGSMYVFVRQDSNGMLLRSKRDPGDSAWTATSGTIYRTTSGGSDQSFLLADDNFAIIFDEGDENRMVGAFRLAASATTITILQSTDRGLTWVVVA